ncbi:uncharacterized protein LOC117100891 [Anneissia japonica]|uniref:uncharacterized protein LOC117100891 n=1 Tax=Anneissia japonica TaxID=1529436 RepID=UPI0014256FB9|nr:uncharacterized protein LOC117100891 [Anneissia japonica]
MFMKENPPVKETQTRHTIWLKLYESFLQANDVYCGTLSAEALEEHIEKWYKKKTLFIEKRKSEAEQRFLTRTEVQTMSRASKSSRASQGSSARRIAEAKRLSELKKQSELLRVQQESENKLKLLEIELQQERERSAIANEMAKSRSPRTAPGGNRGRRK